MSSHHKKTCFVQFQYSQKTSPGEDIHITGNIPSLGQWNVEKSEKMVTSNDEYPLWKSRENIIVEQDTEIQYKYLIFDNKKFKCWENNENRRVKIGKYYKVVIKDPGSQIINSVSDHNLSNISNSEISKTENQLNELIAADEIDITNLNNEIMDSEQITNTINYEEQFIFSNKKNELILPNESEKLYEGLNPDNDANFTKNLNEDFKIDFDSNSIYYNMQEKNDSEIIDINIKNIINEISPINSQIFNNVLKNDLNKNEQDIGNVDVKKDKNGKTDNILDEKKLLINLDPQINEIKEPLIKEINIIKKENYIYNKIIICSFYLPVEIKDTNIYPLSDYIYPNLFQLYKTNPNIYFIGLLKKSNKIPENKIEEIYQKLKADYRMFPLEITEEFYEQLINYIDVFANPFINDLQINISNIKNNDINNLLEEIHLKYNEIVAKNIIDISKGGKFLLILFDYYFIFVPQILKQKLGQKFSLDIGLQYIFLNKMCCKERFIMLPYYKNIIKSLILANIIVFPSFYNCFLFLNLTKLIKEFKYKVNIESDIMMEINFNEKNETKDNHYLILRVENIFPDYHLLKSVFIDKQYKNTFEEIEQLVLNIKKNENHFIFLSIDDIKYLPFIKIKLLGIKSFIENIIEEKYKISFIQVITGEYMNKKEKTNNINSNININEEKKELEKDYINEMNFAEITCLISEINSNYKNKIIELIHKDINLYEKLFLLNNADCFIKTLDDINSPFFIYEYLMAKLILIHNKRNYNEEENNNIKDEIKKEKEISEFPIAEYIIGNQIKEIPGLNKYLLVNPYDFKNIDLELSRAFRNLINCHKNKNIYDKEHSKCNDFIFVRKYFDIEKQHYYKFNDEKEIKIPKNNNVINKSEKIIKLDINKITKQYEDVIKSINNEESKLKNKFNTIVKIIAFNLDFLLFDDNYEDEENSFTKKIILLFSNIISLAFSEKNNIILLYSKKDNSELDDIINKYIKKNSQKYEKSFHLLNNIIILSNDGYFFKKISNHKIEGDNQWIKIRMDLEGYPFSEREIINILLGYKENCSNIKLEQNSNKIYIYNDDCNKEQVDLYINDFKNIINNDDNYKNFLIIDKIKNGYCITNLLNYKALFLSKILKEMINQGKKIKFILFFGFNKTDEYLYEFLEKKKNIIEKYIKEELYINIIKLIKCHISNNTKEEKNDWINNDITNNEYYNNLYYNDNIDEIISLLKIFVDLENKDAKKINK